VVVPPGGNRSLMGLGSMPCEPPAPAGRATPDPNTSLDEGDVVRILQPRTVERCLAQRFPTADTSQAPSCATTARQALRAINRFTVCETAGFSRPLAATQDPMVIW